MGKSKKPSFADKLKANLAKAGDEAAKVAKKGLEAAKDGAEIVADQATKAAKVSADAAKKGLEAAKDGAHVVAEKAGEAKAYVDAKSRELLDKAYAKKRELAAEHLQKVRAKHPNATPVEIQQELEKELHANEEELGAESETFSTAVTIYVLASFEVHGAKPSDSEAHQKLIDAILVLDSEVSKGIQKYGGLAVELLLGRVKTAGKVAKIALDASKKIAKFQPLIKTLGIQNIGKQSMSAIVISATKKNLGETPSAWKA
ncbi:MAG: hypothetical protein RL683_115 [Actinomycetota bacterium]